MFISDEGKKNIRDGLELIITLKQADILSVKSKTEKDYESLKPIHELLHKTPMNWKEKQLDEIYAIKKEIEQIQSLYNQFNQSSNQVLIIPHTARINVNITN